MEDFLHQYGYLALAIGTFLEGETAILVASSLVYSGIFGGVETVFFGFFGSFLGDWMYYLIGRLNGTYFVERRPKLKLRLDPARRFFETHRFQVLISYRFLYGLRAVLPIMIGLTGVRPFHFLAFSVAAGLLWASLVSATGYLAGQYFQFTPQTFEEHGLLVILAFATFGLAVGTLVKRIAEQRLNIPSAKP
ncbi:MAG: DedA family protein [Cyclobacteriaceae bacterium]|nr:DedA family protein [Cyclobacteriaceae bacterium]